MSKDYKTFDKATLKPNSNALKEYKECLPPLNHEQKEALIGMILGDASLQKQAREYRVKYDLSNKNRPYVDHIIELLDGYVLSEPRITTRGNATNVAFQTISHKEFNQIGELFIRDGKKCVPAGLIRDHLTPRGLAYWFMDDGGKTDYTGQSHGIDFHTQGFTWEDVENMSKELNDKFKFHSWIKENHKKPIIRISSIEFLRFLNLVGPFMHPHMRYKLPKKNRLIWRHSLNSYESKRDFLSLLL